MCDFNVTLLTTVRWEILRDLGDYNKCREGTLKITLYVSMLSPVTEHQYNNAN